MTHVLAARGITTVTKAEIVATIGMPLEEALALWVGEEEKMAVTAEYRAAFPDVGLPHVGLLPGACEALAGTHISELTVLTCPIGNCESIVLLCVVRSCP